MINRTRKFVIIGGGPAGLTGTHEAVRRGHRAVLLEKDEILGGISRTASYRGYHFDMGGHRFFTKSREVQKFWSEILGDDFIERDRLSRIYYRKKFFLYPLKMVNTLRGLGLWECVLILASYIRWKVRPHPVEETFEQWVTNRFGKRLFLTFFKSYTEKVWGISCSELKAEWAAQRIKGLSLWSALTNMLGFRRGSVKSLIERFHYPRRGPGMMWREVARRIENAGGEIRMQSDVVRLKREGNRITAVLIDSGGMKSEIKGTDFISSMPLTELVRKLDPPAPPEVLAAADQLKYRDFLTVCLIIDQPELFDDNWIYIHEPGVKVGRIQNYKNWSPDMVPDPSKSSLGLEYFCQEGDEIWTMDDKDLVALAKQEVNQLGLAVESLIEDGCVFRIPKSYPVYDSDYRDHLEVLRAFVDGIENLQTIGRNGLHRYNNQDHAMLTGLRAIQNSLDATKHDLWGINAEQEYHEEVNADESAANGGEEAEFPNQMQPTKR